jgi:hypothetical protein
VHIGKTLFAQVIAFVQWPSLARIVQRHTGDSGVRTLSCAEQFRAMPFAQLTWRETLRDSRRRCRPMRRSSMRWDFARRSGATRGDGGISFDVKPVSSLSRAERPPLQPYSTIWSVTALVAAQ